MLISIVANGYAMTSQYIENPDGERLDKIEFELEKGVSKSLVVTRKGKPLKGAKVFPLSRKTAYDEEFLIYYQSAAKVTLNTDDNGKVAMNIFMDGDTAKLGVSHRGQKYEVELKIDDSNEQTLEVLSKKKVSQSDLNHGSRQRPG